MAQGHKCVIVNATGCVMDPQLNIHLKFIFTFLRTGFEAKPPNTPTSPKNRKWSVLTLGSLPTLLCAGNRVKLYISLPLLYRYCMLCVRT